MTDRYPLPEWPGYTVSDVGIVFNKQGTALSHDSLGRVALRKQGRMLRVHVGECLKMAGLIHVPHAGENYAAIVSRCRGLEEELEETQKRFTDQKKLLEEIKILEQERDLAEAGLKKARAELGAAKVVSARKARTVAEKPTSSCTVANAERKLRHARKVNAHLIALLHQKGSSVPADCFLDQSSLGSDGDTIEAVSSQNIKRS